jgi:hypothetical protein
MQKTITKAGLYLSLFLMAGSANAQMQMPATPSDTAAEFKPHGKLWGYAFGDAAYKGGTDEQGRGGSNQYTKIPVNSNLFQWRRIYLGYNYEISKKFVAEFLLAAEDDFASGVLGQGNGDILQNNKFTPYVKLANLRWKNIFKNTDLVLGQSPTPTFAQGSALSEYARNTQTSEEVWGYRSIERTITDIRRSPSFDFGASLQGWFDSKGNFGYDLMVANGQSDKPENDQYKWFYGDVYAKFMDKKLVIDLYQDYEKLHWGVFTKGPQQMWYNDRNMTKLFVAYNTPKFTAGFEGFMATFMGDVVVTGKDNNTYYRTTKAMGLSFFTRGSIVKDKLGFFARFDNYDPTGNLAAIVSDPNTKSYTATTSQYDPTNKEMFVTYGLDFTPMKKIHIMPNIWLNTYKSGVDPTVKNTNGIAYGAMNTAGMSSVNGSDVVYRLTFYYVYGK